MKSFFRMSITTLTMIFSLALSSCNQNEQIEPETNNPGLKTYKMSFVGNIQEYGSASTRAENTTWNDGDKLYISFYEGDKTFSGTAIYAPESGWELTYDGSFHEVTNEKCKVYFFRNISSETEYVVTLNPNTEMYEDTSATYTFSDNTLSVQGVLNPKLGRIRFTGNENDSLIIDGISTYTSFTLDINNFTTTDMQFVQKVTSSGSTPYIYGYLTEKNRSIGVITSYEDAYTKECAEGVLDVGESGYMAIPTESSSNGWEHGLYIYLDDSEIEFKMVPVTGHEDGLFLMGETEVTEKVYGIIMNLQYNSNAPRVFSNYTYINDFIKQLNVKTGFNFSIPTLSQWLFAAKGGENSLGYLYSGSNNADDVAWYINNSDGKLHDVKQKTPNELGIYDMSGNYSECATDLDNNGKLTYYGCGGYYNSTDSDITNSSYYVNKSSKIGLRLVLTLN